VTDCGCNTRSNWSATSSWKENVFSIFNSLTKVKNISFVTQVYNKEPQSVTILPFAIENPSLSRYLLAQNIFWTKSRQKETQIPVMLFLHLQDIKRNTVFMFLLM
jgi:hypothetical protein